MFRIQTCITTQESEVLLLQGNETGVWAPAPYHHSHIRQQETDSSSSQGNTDKVLWNLMHSTYIQFNALLKKQLTMITWLRSRLHATTSLLPCMESNRKIPKAGTSSVAKEVPLRTLPRLFPPRLPTPRKLPFDILRPGTYAKTWTPTVCDQERIRSSRVPTRKNDRPVWPEQSGLGVAPEIAYSHVPAGSGS